MIWSQLLYQRFNIKQEELFDMSQSDEDSVLIDFSLTVKAATSIFIYGRGSAVSSAKEGESGIIYLVKCSKAF